VLQFLAILVVFWQGHLTNSQLTTCNLCILSSGKHLAYSGTESFSYQEGAESLILKAALMEALPAAIYESHHQDFNTKN
jgi:hypothetical protein